MKYPLLVFNIANKSFGNHLNTNFKLLDIRKVK